MCRLCTVVAAWCVQCSSIVVWPYRMCGCGIHIWLCLYGYPGRGIVLCVSVVLASLANRLCDVSGLLGFDCTR